MVATAVRHRHRSESETAAAAVVRDVEVDGVTVPMPEPFKRVPNQAELVQLQREEAQKLVPDRGKRDSKLPSWYLDDLRGKQDKRPSSRQKASRRRTGRPGSSGAARRTSVARAGSGSGSKSGSRGGGRGDAVQSAMTAATTELAKIQEEA